MADMLGMGGLPFDEDDILADDDDEDLQKDPVSEIDLRVSYPRDIGSPSSPPDRTLPNFHRPM